MNNAIKTILLVVTLVLISCFTMIDWSDPSSSAKSPSESSAQVAAEQKEHGNHPSIPEPEKITEMRLVRADQEQIAPPNVAAAAPKFDPRFEQPATQAGLFGPDEATMQKHAAEALARSQREKAEAEEWARENHWPLAGVNEDGMGFEIMRLENGAPVYNGTQNTNARISHNVSRINQFDTPGSNPNLSGDDWTVALFELGKPRLSHHDFALYSDLGSPRVTYRDEGIRCEKVLNEIQDHATHVLGTLIGNGYSEPDARGMAWLANAVAFNWCDDDAEMRSIGATAPNQPDRVYVSNHSYGEIAGWAKLTPSNLLGDAFGGKKWVGRAGDSEPRAFGLYGSTAREYDKTCRLAPYLLPFIAAGNDRGELPSHLQEVQWPAYNADGTVNSSPNEAVWGLSAGDAPGPDGGTSGFDSILTSSIGKNPMIVGNFQDAVSSDSRSISGIEMVSSSGFGPTDDGRIKPDIVANGAAVYSATKGADDAYGDKTGTSMATPGAAGTALLLHQHYKNLTGQTMRASTLKALMIHTATDILNPGPDYKSGWGLVDAWKATQHIDLHADHPGNFHIYEDFLSEERREIRLQFTASSPVKATLVWTDPEGSTKSNLDDPTPVLVNDLDIVLRGPNGTFYRAPQLNLSNPNALPVYSGNAIDTVEQLGGGQQDIPAMPGIYELIISYDGDLSEPSAQDPDNKKQVFSLMLEGNTPESIGTLADAVDSLDRSFTRPTSGAVAGFAYQADASANDSDRAVNLPIDHSESAACETTVDGPTTVSFSWGVSSEANYDYLRFYLDDTLIEEISGDVATHVYAYVVPAGSHTLRWSYEKDSNTNSGSDQGWVDAISFNNFTDGIDNSDYLWTQTSLSSLPWGNIEIEASAIPTGDIARSGDVEPLEYSEMTTTIEGPALVQFTMAQTAPNGTLRAKWPTGFILHSKGNVYRRYSAILGPGSHEFTFSWRNPVEESGHGLIDQFMVTPLPDDGSLGQAADIPLDAEYTDLMLADASEAAWIPDVSNAAPTGRSREPGASAIRTVFTPMSEFPNTTNNTAVTYTVKGPSLLSFWWQCTGAPDGNLKLEVLQVNVDTEYHDASPASNGPRALEPISGGTGWQQVYYEVPDGLYVFRWSYTAGANDVPGSAWLDQISVTPDATHPARGLDHWSQRWESYGDAGWYAESDNSNGGIDSTSHGKISDNESTTLTTTVVGPKKLFFNWKVSSEANWDFLRFTMDGEELVPGISGTTDWSTVKIDIPAGNHVLRWTYEKDISNSLGEDRGWVDSVAILRPDFGIASVNVQSASGYNLISIRKDQTAGFFLEASTDLLNWTTLGATPSSLNSSGMISPRLENYSTLDSTTERSRYYRLRFEPEVAIEIENPDFEVPFLISANPPFLQSGPGWTDDNDGEGQTVFEFVQGFSSTGLNHFSVAGGTYAETKDSFFTYSGVLSVTAAIGNRPGFTTPNNVSSVALMNQGELARSSHFATNIPEGTFKDGFPASFDFFSTDPDSYYDVKVRLISEGSRSNFDNVRVVLEPR
ncbi:S8 family serine peptidase [Roseibacillus persicicus]|nr:S8 family serine peptidase [Roseibacillus persicicus]